MVHAAGRMTGSLGRAGAAILLALLVSGCATADPEPQQTRCSGDEQYIPRDTFAKSYPGSDEARRRWYSTSLLRMAEPSLSCGDWQGVETYRFLWLQSFAHPIAVRVTRQGRRTELLAVQLSGIGGGDPGAVLQRVRKELSIVDWGLLESALWRSGFWSLPTSGNMYGLHGEQWVVEGRRNESYHIVDRWSPPEGAYRDLGLFFFDLAGWPRPATTPQ